MMTTGEKQKAVPATAIRRAIGQLGTIYEVRGVRLFIDGEEARRTDGQPWASIAEAKNAADSAEIAEAHNQGLTRRSWKVIL